MEEENEKDERVVYLRGRDETEQSKQEVHLHHDVGDVECPCAPAYAAMRHTQLRAAQGINMLH